MGGSRRAYSALSALLGEGRDEATACLAAYRDVLTETALGRKDQRPPKPHVTIARPRQRAADGERAAGLEWAKSVDLGGVRVTLTRLGLYTWNEKRQEKLFRIVAERALVPKATPHPG